LDDFVRAEILAGGGDLANWLSRRAPAWRRVGRVCFHLAENKRDPEQPFAFLATYAPRLTSGARVQYQPLGQALREYAGAKNKRMLVNLLSPVQRAAERLAWVKTLVDTGDMFHPLAWTPKEAIHFLRDAAALEESGLLVRMPDWWTKRRPRVRVNVSIGNKTQSRFGSDAMLDFRVAVALDGEELTLEEQTQILHAAQGLVFLKGRWVEVDQEKITQALEHWRTVEREAGDDGLSFLQGMRLLAGAPIETGEADLFNEQQAAWTEIQAGAWLSDRLAQLRARETADAPGLDAELRAQLRPYQKTGVQWLWLLSQLGLGACLADDMGLGKTVQVLALLLRMKKNRAGPALVVLPASLLANWKAEVEKFSPSLRCLYAHPSQMKPGEWAVVVAADFSVEPYDVVFTTYSMLTRLPWLEKTEWALAAADEAQALKNPGARQTRATKRLKARARVALTGTPVENRLTDLWSIFDFLCPGLLGNAKAFGDFVKRLESRATERYAPLRRLTAPYILRRMKTDKTIIADLPDKVEVTVFSGLSKKQALLYEQAVRELEKTLELQKEGIARRGAILGFILRFKQICNHPAQWLGGGSYALEDSGKFLRLGTLCEELADRQEKALIFTQFREITEPLSAFLCGVFGRAGLILHGGTAVGKRKSLVDEFQREDGPPFMVLSLKAGGTGLNLTAATHVVHFDRWWNPAVENQATDRAFRIGQKRNVMVHKFVCQGTIEEKIDALIRDKTALAGEILSEGATKLVTEMSDAELLSLARLDLSRATEE
jgi:non-specific serine/threonine protein kinase